MITNPEWLKPKEKPHFHQISLDCIEKLVDCLEMFNKEGEIDFDMPFKIYEKYLSMMLIKGEGVPCLWISDKTQYCLTR